VAGGCRQRGLAFRRARAGRRGCLLDELTRMLVASISVA
jgi:hypothetical protein